LKGSLQIAQDWGVKRLMGNDGFGDATGVLVLDLENLNVSLKTMLGRWEMI
jgi:hypothetical protein